MALRKVRETGDEILRKKAKPVKEMTPRLAEIIQDMFDTMYETGGVGLAAPQVGILKRAVVIDTGQEEPDPLVLINPEILEEEGEQTGAEGCLSVPGKHAIVVRPEKVRFRALDIGMEPYEREAEGLLARAVCHEVDHLEGILYTDKMTGPLMDNDSEEEEEEEAGEGGES